MSPRGILSGGVDAGCCVQMPEECPGPGCPPGEVREHPIPDPKVLQPVPGLSAQGSRVSLPVSCEAAHWAHNPSDPFLGLPGGGVVPSLGISKRRFHQGWGRRRLRSGVSVWRAVWLSLEPPEVTSVGSWLGGLQWGFAEDSQWQSACFVSGLVEGSLSIF